MLPSHRRPRRRLVAGLLALSFALASCSSDSAGDDTGRDDDTPEDISTTTAMTGVLTATADVLAGQCFNQVPDPAQQPFGVFVVACDEPHEFEVFSKTFLELGAPTPPGTPYPGNLTVANAAETQCYTGFSAYVGAPWETSEWDLQVWWPTADSWTTTDDRVILCAVFSVTAQAGDGRVTGTARNSGR